MSRIRSHLDAIMSGGDNREPQPALAPAPRPAYPRAPAADNHSGQPPASVPQRARSLQDIHKSLDQLASRVSAVTQNNNAAHAAPVNNGTAGATAMLQEIRQEIHKGISQARQELGNSLDNDLQRIANGIAALQNGQNVHPGYVDQMQAELQNLNAGIRQIAEMQSASPASQIDLSGVSQSIESGYSEIVQKLDQVLAQRGNELPALPEINIPDYSNDFKALATRIEEVSRAVVSMSVSAGDMEEQHALERIEARLASLAKTIESAPAANAASLGDQVFADMASHQEAVAAELARLSQHLEVLQSSEASSPAAEYAGQLSQNLAGLEEQIATLADRIDGLNAGAAENANAGGQEILSVLQNLVGRVEAIEQLATQAAHEDHEGGTDVADRFASLETQLSSIASQLGTSAIHPETGEAQPPLPGSIVERLENIEGQIAASRDIVIDMATQAAQGAVGAPGENAASLDALQLSQLDDVLAELRQIRETGTGENQGSENLEGIAQAIQAISARLDQMEMVQTWPAGQPEDSAGFGDPVSAQDVEMHASEAPYVPEAPDAVQHADHAEFFEQGLPQVHDAPPLAPEHDLAFADPLAPQAGEIQPEYPAEFHSEQQVEMSAPVAEVRPPEAEAEDVPLEPGSGMPDLESLVRRATNRKRAKNEPASEESGEDDGINDLMAAARRAAQAASVQAQSQREREAVSGEKPTGRKRFSFGKPSIFSRKALLTSVAIVALAVAGWAIVPKFLGGPDNTEISQGISQEQSMPAAEAGDEDVAVDGEETVDAGDGEITDADQSADGEMLAEAPQDEPLGQPAGEMFAPAPEENTSDAAEQPQDSEATPAMATGSESVAIPEGMPGEIGNPALLQDAAAGDGNALFEIARRYTEGDGVDRNLETAATWYQKAADLGHGPSQYRLGNFYEKGHGVTADTGKAAEWYSKAAAAGNALAMHNLAVLNVQGLLGSDPDMETAIGWFEKAAGLGVKDSQVNLGILYTRGMGVKADLEQAYKWFAIAAKGGDNDAATKRDTVAKNMRPEQLEKARGEAEIWKPKTLDRTANAVSIKESWKKGSTLERAALPQKELVRRTQAILTRLGFDPGPADGIMGAKTEEAIKAYQEKSGLPVDGRITPALLEVLSAQAV